MISSTSVVQESWSIFKKQWLTIIGSLILLWIFSLVVQITLIVPILGLLTFLFVTYPISAILYQSVFLQFARKESVTISSAFKDVSIRTVVHTFLSMMLLGATRILLIVVAGLTFLSGLVVLDNLTEGSVNILQDIQLAVGVAPLEPAMVTSIVSVAVMIALLVALFYTIALFCRLSLTFLSVIDKKNNVINAVKHSWMMTRGNNWCMFKLMFLWSTLFVIIGTILFILGLFLFTIPMILLLLPVLYNKLNMSSDMPVDMSSDMPADTSSSMDM